MDGQTRRELQKWPGSPARLARFRHRSHAAPGRGCCIVDDTFAAHRSEMTAVIREARRRSGPG